MTHRPARTRGQRTADSLAMLDGEVDVWVATASEQDGVARPHLVPVSLAWFEERVVIAVQATSRTALDLSTGGVARLGVGPTRDVVMIDVVLDESHPVEADVHRLSLRPAPPGPGPGVARGRRDPRPDADARRGMARVGPLRGGGQRFSDDAVMSSRAT